MKGLTGFCKRYARGIFRQITQDKLQRDARFRRERIV